MIAFSHYAKTYNNFGIKYTGAMPEYAIQLDKLVPLIRSAYPEFIVKLYVPDEFVQITKEGLPVSQFNPREFAFVKEIFIDPNSNNVHKFAEEMGITICTT
jgi:hypothetical protein